MYNNCFTARINHYQKQNSESSKWFTQENLSNLHSGDTKSLDPVNFDHVFEISEQKLSEFSAFEDGVSL